jgi:uncharacterized protein YutE (UPF0331/DUF86 family)
MTVRELIDRKVKEMDDLVELVPEVARFRSLAEELGILRQAQVLLDAAEQEEERLAKRRLRKSKELKDEPVKPADELQEENGVQSTPAELA